MTIRWLIAGAMGTALVVAPAVAFAQAPPPAAEKANKRGEQTATKSSLPAGDRKFVNEALKANHAEVELGKLASEKASNDAVKKFGQRMADDHGKANEELKKLAQDKGLSAPTELDARHKKLHDRLAKLSGPQFDRAYMDEMVKDHRKDVKEFQREADKAKDPDVKSHASKTLPVLQDHLKQAEDIHTQMKGQKAEKK